MWNRRTLSYLPNFLFTLLIVLVAHVSSFETQRSGSQVLDRLSNAIALSRAAAIETLQLQRSWLRKHVVQ